MSFCIVRYTVEDSFIVGKKFHLTKLGFSEAGKPWTLKSGGGLEPMEPYRSLRVCGVGKICNFLSVTRHVSETVQDIDCDS